MLARPECEGAIDGRLVYQGSYERSRHLRSIVVRPRSVHGSLRFPLHSRRLRVAGLPVFSSRQETQAPTPVPETDLWYYRQRPRRAIQLLLDRVEQLSKELEAARQEIARLKGYRTTPRRE
jgi:hypothetical protein